MITAVPEKSALVLDTRNPKLIQDAIPRNQLINPNTVAVKHCTDTIQILKNLGFDISGYEPIHWLYDYPLLFGEHTPMDHQRVTAAFLNAHPRCYVLNQQRTGKTSSVVWAADFLRKEGTITGSILVVSTLSTVRSVWENEIFGVTPSASTGVAWGSRKQRQKVLNDKPDWIIINHDGIKLCEHEIGAMVESGEIGLIVVDEGGEFADHTTDKWESLNIICKSVKRLWWLTATPMSRGPDKVWGQARIVNKKLVPVMFTEWRWRVMTKVSKYKWVALPDAESKVYAALQPGVRFKKRDVLQNLPPITHQTLDVPLSDAQKKAIRQIKAEGATMTAEGDIITAANAAVQVGKILQICGGTVKDDDGAAVKVKCTERLAAARSLINGTDEKVIIFASYHATLDMLAHEFRTFQPIQIDGRVTGRKRDRLIELFKSTKGTDKRRRLLIAHPKVVSHGLEFSVADTTIWWNPHPSAEVVAQANERMASAAQKNPMGIYYLASHWIEKQAYRTVHQGLALQEKALSMYKNLMKETD